MKSIFSRVPGFSLSFFTLPLAPLSFRRAAVVRLSPRLRGAIEKGSSRARVPKPDVHITLATSAPSVLARVRARVCACVCGGRRSSCRLRLQLNWNGRRRKKRTKLAACDRERRNEIRKKENDRERGIEGESHKCAAHYGPERRA